MAESRQTAGPVSPSARGLLPPPALCGFLLLLIVVFSVSCAVGSASGPVAPGMHGTRDAGPGGGGEGDGMEDMPGTHGSDE